MKKLLIGVFISALFTGQAIANDLAIGIGPIFAIVMMGHKIAEEDRPFATPFMLDIVKADGIVKGANPTLRRGLIAELEATLTQLDSAKDEDEASDTTGVQSLFVRAPSKP